MSRTMKRRIYCGAICEQIVYQVPDRVKDVQSYDPETRVKRERFRSDEEYQKFKESISRRRHFQSFQANYGPEAIFCTLTFDVQNEVTDFIEARQVRNNFRRALERACPEARFRIYMGRGRTTHRIHFHMVSSGVPVEVIRQKWKYGEVKRPANLRKRCKDKQGRDIGQDYSALANYLFDHWTEEQGGHRWFATKNERQPEREAATEVKVRGGYGDNRPPIAPKGYSLTVVFRNEYGYQYFRYVADKPEEYGGG